MLKRNLLALALFGVVNLSAVAASVEVGTATNSNVTANLTLDSADIGKTLNVYVAAIFGGKVYMRGSKTTDWSEYKGGPLPVAGTIKTTSANASVSVVDFDISILPGIEIYVAFGSDEADIRKPGRLAKIYTVATSAACDTSQAPAGVSYSVSGNSVTVSTNGKCIALPATGAQACAIPAPPQATGISILTSVDVKELSLGGISVNIPGIPNPFDAAAKALGTVKTCTKNAPADYGKYSITADVCYDITAQLQSSMTAQTAAFVTVNPPVTAKYKGTFVTSNVGDCFTSGAQTVMDAFSKEAWIKQADNSYKKL